MEQLVNEATASQRQPYEQKPIDTTGINLPPAILGLGEKLDEEGLRPGYGFRNAESHLRFGLRDPA